MNHPPLNRDRRENTYRSNIEEVGESRQIECESEAEREDKTPISALSTKHCGEREIDVRGQSTREKRRFLFIPFKKNHHNNSD